VQLIGAPVQSDQVRLLLLPDASHPCGGVSLYKMGFFFGLSLLDRAIRSYLIEPTLETVMWAESVRLDGNAFEYVSHLEVLLEFHSITAKLNVLQLSQK
jgi:hypothetical protein